MHPLALLTSYSALIMTPLLLAWMQDLPARSPWDDLASGLGMAAFVVLLVEFALSGRIRAISGRIGLDVTMRFHQLIARTALVCLALHPFMYSTPFDAVKPWDATRQLSLQSDIEGLGSGVVAWIVLPGLIVLAVLRDRQPFSYETWRLLHLVGATVAAVAVMHHALAVGRYSASFWLFWFWWILVSVAVGALVFGRLVAPLLKARHPYEVVSVRTIALDTLELVIRPVWGSALEFRAGQFVWLNLAHSAFSLHENPFSISSAPAQRPDVHLIIKEVGDFTRRLRAVVPGTPALLDGPHGNLVLDGRETGGVALIAGGVGIAPLLAIARQMVADDDPRSLVLLYGNRCLEQVVYADELQALAARPNTRVIPFLSEPTAGWSGMVGQLDSSAISEQFDFEGNADWLYLVCGPPAMIEGVEAALIGMKVPADRIVSERFYYE